MRPVYKWIVNSVAEKVANESRTKFGDKNKTWKAHQLTEKEIEVASSITIADIYRFKRKWDINKQRDIENLSKAICQVSHMKSKLDNFKPQNRP